MRFTTNKEVDAAVRSVMAVADHLLRGDTLGHEQIEEASGFPKDSVAWKCVVVKFRKRMLRERNIALRPVVNIGYKLCTHDEQLKWCARNRQKRAIRQVNRGVSEVGAVPADDLTLHQQRLRALTLQTMISERRALKRGVRQQADEIRKTETLPRRPIMP